MIQIFYCVEQKYIITELENLEQNQISIDEVYDGFCKVLIDEMSDKLPHKIVKESIIIHGGVKG